MKIFRKHRDILAMLLGFIAAASLTSVSQARPAPEHLEQLPLNELKSSLQRIDKDLSKLSNYSFRSGTGSIGFRTNIQPDSNQQEWIDISFESETNFDQIILVPTVWRDSEKQTTIDAFPAEFRILTKSGETSAFREIYRSGPEKHSPARKAPLVISLPNQKATTIRLLATQLTRRALDGEFSLQLSEIFVFDKQHNVALGRKITSSSPSSLYSHSWKEQYLVDGYTPYFMNAAGGRKSRPMIVRVAEHEPVHFTIDLEKETTISEIHLHLVDQSDTVPQSTLGDFGLSKKITFEAANNPDFSDKKVIHRYHWQDLYDIGPIISFDIPETKCRYVRLTAEDHYLSIHDHVRIPRVGFAEIELISNGQNVAVGKRVLHNFPEKSFQGPITGLTDGQNLYGSILPLKKWMGELALRHDLEKLRPLLVRELDKRYTNQKKRLHLMSWLVAVLAAGIVIIILVDRIIRMRHIARIRMRFAADLHDELGANLHTIGLLGDVALSAVEDPPERLANALRRSRDIIERTSVAVRHCTEMQLASSLYGTLKEDMERTARRVFSDVTYTLSIEDEEILNTLKPRTRADLFLFFKECLVNISRHSGATEFSARLHADGRRILLEITDNGQGIGDSPRIPTSLKRRARLLGAKVTLESPPTGGTTIRLKIRRSRFQLSTILYSHE